MDSCHDCRGIQGTHDKASQSKGKSQHPLDPVKNRVFSPHKDRSDDSQCQVSRHKHTDQRSDKQIQHFRHNLVQFLLYYRQQPYRDDDRDHMSLITYHIDIIKPEEYGLCLLYALCRHCVCILQ